MAWIYDIYCKTGIKVPFPIIADRSGEIARKYGMISNNVSSTETVRNVYIIDPNGIIRLILIYPLNVGRFIPEIIRAVNALQVADCNKASTPANWIPCQPLVSMPPNTVEGMNERIDQINQGKNGMSWYLSFQKPTNCKEIERNGIIYTFVAGLCTSELLLLVSHYIIICFKADQSMLST